MSTRAIRYLICTFAIDILAWGGLAALTSLGHVQSGQVLYWILYLIGGISPCISAVILYFAEKDSAVRADFRRALLRLNVNPIWYLFVLIVPMLPSLLSWLIARASGSGGPFAAVPVYAMALLFLEMIIGGGLEEVGWRGVLLPELLKKMASWKAALLVGGIWSLWHVPLWFIVSTPQHGSELVPFVISVIGMSFAFTVLYAGTRSIVLCVFMHSLFNTYGQGIPGAAMNGYARAAIALALFVVVFVVREVALTRRASLAAAR